MIRVLVSVLLFYIAFAMTDSAAMYLGIASNRANPEWALYEQYGNRLLLGALTAWIGLGFAFALRRERGTKIPQYRLRTLLIFAAAVAIWGGLLEWAARPSITIPVIVVLASLVWVLARSRRSGSNGGSPSFANTPQPQSGSPLDSAGPGKIVE